MSPVKRCDFFRAAHSFCCTRGNGRGPPPDDGLAAGRWAGGQATPEFALVLPFAVLLILAVIEAALLGVRGAVAEHTAMRAARIASVYQEELADGELLAMLKAPLFRGGWVESSDPQGVRILAEAYPLTRLRAFEPAMILRRKAPRADALPDGLSEAILRGGDTPAPYCKEGGNYNACDY